MWQGHEEEAAVGERRRRRGPETAVAARWAGGAALWGGKSFLAPSGWGRGSGLRAAVGPPPRAPWLRHDPQGTP